MRQDLVMTGYMGLSGTDKLVALERTRLSRRLTMDFLDQAAREYRQQQACSSRAREKFFSVLGDPEGQAGGLAGIWENGPEGFLQALWGLSRSWETGFTVRLREVPVRQETIEICEILEVNPYELESDGCLWIAADHGHRLCEELKKEGIPAAVIGELTDSNDCLLVHDDTISYLNRPQEEEYSRYRRMVDGQKRQSDR